MTSLLPRSQCLDKYFKYYIKNRRNSILPTICELLKYREIRGIYNIYIICLNPVVKWHIVTLHKTLHKFNFIKANKLALALPPEVRQSNYSYKSHTTIIPKLSKLPSILSAKNDWLNPCSHETRCIWQTELFPQNLSSLTTFCETKLWL